MAKALLLISGGDDVSSPKILPLGAVTVLQVPPLLEVMSKTSSEWQKPSSCTFVGSGLPATSY